VVALAASMGATLEVGAAVEIHGPA
jgi:hypothetical protein